METKKKEELQPPKMPQKPAPYVSQNQDQIDKLYGQINDRKFNYNPANDAYYQQALDTHLQMGKTAMQDTVGQLSALTGGYGNSYAQTAGQQAYQGYLTKAAGLAPQYEAMARERFNAEGDDLMRQYGMLSQKEQNEYGRYQDAWNQFLQGQQLQQQQDQWQHQLDREAIADQKDAYNHILMLIQAGHKISDEDLEKAGMSKKEYKRWRRDFRGGAAEPESNGPNQWQQWQDWLNKTGGGGGDDSVPSGGMTYEQEYDALVGAGATPEDLNRFQTESLNEHRVDPGEAHRVHNKYH